MTCLVVPWDGSCGTNCLQNFMQNLLTVVPSEVVADVRMLRNICTTAAQGMRSSPGNLRFSLGAGKSAD
jgi:hypothetical protein